MQDIPADAHAAYAAAGACGALAALAELTGTTYAGAAHAGCIMREGVSGLGSNAIPMSAVSTAYARRLVQI